VPGKVDWLAHNLPVEGERANPPTAGRLARDDLVRVNATDRADDVLRAIERSRYPFALVTGAGGMVLGRIQGSALESESDRPVGELMELDPYTVRPHRSAAGVAERLTKRDLKFAIVTTPEGRLIGVARREDLERAAQA
jgi:Mg/Co/Ni transporter MgtE